MGGQTANPDQRGFRLCTQEAQLAQFIDALTATSGSNVATTKLLPVYGSSRRPVGPFHVSKIFFLPPFQQHPSPHPAASVDAPATLIPSCDTTISPAPLAGAHHPRKRKIAKRTYFHHH